MSSTPVWPDRVQYSDAVQNPGSHFDDHQLREAAFVRGRFGTPMAWSGGRAIVFRAVAPDGSHTAVRFLLSNDRDAEARYLTLARRLVEHPVATLVKTRWLGSGLHIGGHDYPVMVMDWVEGRPLDRHIEFCLESPYAADDLRFLCDAWLLICRSLSAAAIGHGDVHAGNTLVRTRDGRACDIQLVDYDNVWVPGLPALCGYEAGHPAFQHPTRASMPNGPQMDAFPNTLTYLSLLALANDPSLWRFHEGSDDVLLFQPEDLYRLDDELWAALMASTDPLVRALTSLTTQWLAGPAEQYDTLDQVIQTAESRHGSSAVIANVWPRPSTANGPASWPPAIGGSPAGPAAASTPRQSWPKAEPQRWPAATTTPGAPDRSKAIRRGVVILLALIAVLIVIGLLAG
jgi:hypothetical protein